MTTSLDRPPVLRALGLQLERAADREAAASRAGRRRLRSGLLVGSTVLLLAGGTGVATGIVPVPGGDGPQFVASEATARLSDDLRARLSGLERPRVARDGLGAAAAFVSGPNGPAPGSSLRLTPPPLPTGTPHASASTVDSWALPTRDGTVSLQQLVPSTNGGPGSGVSADAKMLDAGQAFMTTDDDLIGLAPDGVRSVSVHLQDGSVVSLPVAENVFGAQFDQSVERITLGPSDAG
jgi:hypothetical protein